MSNNLPENVFPISYVPPEEAGNKKGEILWYANGFGWYVSKWNMAYMPCTTHWTYMPEDLDIPSDEELLNREAFATWYKANISHVFFDEQELKVTRQAFDAGRKLGRP
jgi:hypothetical protein